MPLFLFRLMLCQSLVLVLIFLEVFLLITTMTHISCTSFCEVFLAGRNSKACAPCPAVTSSQSITGGNKEFITKHLFMLRVSSFSGDWTSFPEACQKKRWMSKPIWSWREIYGVWKVSSVCWLCRKHLCRKCVKRPCNVQNRWEFKPEKAWKTQINVISTSTEGQVGAFSAAVLSLEQKGRMMG